MAKLPWVGNLVSVRLCKHRGDLWTALFLTASLSTRTNMPRKVIFSEWQRDIVLHSLPVLSTCYTHKFDLPGQICHCSITCSWNCILCIYLHNLFGIRRWANCCLFLPFFFFCLLGMTERYNSISKPQIHGILGFHALLTLTSLWDSIPY